MMEEMQSLKLLIPTQKLRTEELNEELRKVKVEEKELKAKRAELRSAWEKVNADIVRKQDEISEIVKELRIVSLRLRMRSSSKTLKLTICHTDTQFSSLYSQLDRSQFGLLRSLIFIFDVS